MDNRQCRSPNCQDPAAPQRTVCNYHKRMGIDAERKTARNGEMTRWMTDAIASRDRSRCWLDWPFGTGTDGRPHAHGGYAARKVCELVHGPAPEGMIACHSVICRTEKCLNPDHLRWDTWQENTNDIAARHAHMGRMAERGIGVVAIAEHYFLTTAQVRRIIG